MADKSKLLRKSSSQEEKQEALRSRKELIRTRQAKGISSSRRKGRLVRQLSCVSDKEPEAEVQLKRLYIKISKNLPGYGCKLYHVKEVLKGNTQKKYSEIAVNNISDLDEWRTGSGKSHDGLVLEFRGTKTWTLSMLSSDSLKSVTAVLWDALDMHGRFLNSTTLRRESFEFDFQRKQLMLAPDDEGCSKYSKELESLQKLLHFPEEVAILLTTVEAEVFKSVPPGDYIRQVTIDLSRAPGNNNKVSGVEDLIHRFNEVVPYFGGFLRDIRSVFISDYNGEDRFMTRIGVGGIINMEKLKRAQAILNDIQLFHYHNTNATSTGAGDTVAYSNDCCWKMNNDDVFLDSTDGGESETELDFESYQPIRPLAGGHDVMVLTPSYATLGHQCLQFMNHGSTVVHVDEESGRVCMCFMRLEADNVTLTWKKPNWSALRGNVSSLPDYVLRGDFDYSSIQAMYTRYCGGDHVYESIEEGYLDLTNLKEVSWCHEDIIDLTTTSKRFGLDDITPEKNCLCLTYGSTLAENKHLFFAGPNHCAQMWYQGLSKLCQAVRKLHRQTDKRIQWLKMQYLQLYYDNERCQGPTPAEAIRVFGGRRWTPGGPQEASPKPFQQRDSSSSSLTKPRKRSPSPVSRGNRTSIGSTGTTCETSSDTNVILGSSKESATARSQSHPCTSTYVKRYRTRRRSSVLGKHLLGENKNNSITHSTRLSFFDFVDLFRSFSLRSRKDLRDLFDQFALTKPSGIKPARSTSHSITSDSSA
ncbi:PLCE1-like protein [Mya arenaria]|uniref:PLCE1-like protein n=1 Tax=Mya arenaria TaxID=6604 RepID=A0ABY7FL56_MYAAR|nr:PLCE1-like protein [Mya arenaria]